jgi:hypothetical protein
LDGIAGKYSRVAAFQNGTWLTYNPASPFNTLDALDGRLGFWILMSEPATLTATGTPTATPLVLVNGWNLVSYPTTSGAAIADSLSLYSYDTLQAIQNFDAETTVWRTYRPTSPFNNLTDFAPGAGYWIQVIDG